MLIMRENYLSFSYFGFLVSYLILVCRYYFYFKVQWKVSFRSCLMNFFQTCKNEAYSAELAKKKYEKRKKGRKQEQN